MNLYSGVLSLEEKILLGSIKTTDSKVARREIEGLMMSTPTDNEAYPVIRSLYDNLSSGHINIAEELADLNGIYEETII